MNFENNPSAKQEEKEVITELAEEGMAKAENMEGDKLDANVETIKENDKAAVNENLSQVRETMKQEIAQAKAESGIKSPEAIHTPEDMAAISKAFDEIKDALDKKAEGKGIMNKLFFGSAEAKAQITKALQNLESIKANTLSGKNPNINVGLLLQERGIRAFAGSAVSKNSEIIDKFGPEKKNLTYNTHIFGQGA